MNPYMKQFKKQLGEYTARCGCEEDIPVLELLWKCYFNTNPVDDGKIRRSECALQPVFSALSVDAADAIYDRITDFCIAYQRAAFLEGIRIGSRLASELNGEQMVRSG